MKKDDIRTLIVVVPISVICIALVIFFGFEKNIDNLEPVNEYKDFFSITNYVNSYINNASSEDYEIVYNLLDKKYINKNDITSSNISEYVKSYPIGSSVKVSSMKYIKLKDNSMYFIEGKINQNTFDGEIEIDDNFKIIVMLDTNNSSYSIYPITEDYERIINSIRRINIKNNNDNKITNSSTSITNEQICVLYLSDYVSLLNSDIDESYNKLSEGMKKIYTLDSYKDYIRSNKNKITPLADKCSFDDTGANRVYYVIDENNNKYTFKENNILDYKVEIYLNNEDNNK